VTSPDLSPSSQHAEAIAYGRLLQQREIIDALAKERRGLYGNDYYRNGYDYAAGVVKRMKLGVVPVHTEEKR
jgi:hypothetical protein